MKNLAVLVLALAVPFLAEASTLLTFNELPITQYYGQVTNGYGGLQWNEFGVIRPQSYPVNPGGYLASRVSSPNVVFNALSEADGSCTGTFYVDNSVFDLESAYLTAAWHDGLQVTVEGLVGTTLVYSNTYTVNTTAPTLIHFNYVGINAAKVISCGGVPHGYGGGGTMVVFDNMTVNVPGTMTGPGIVTQPLTQTAEVGSPASFPVTVTNCPPGTCRQWFFNNTNALSGATNCILMLTNLQPAQAGSYTFIVTNHLGSVTSAPAFLNIIDKVPREVVPAVRVISAPAGEAHIEFADSLAVSPLQWYSLTNLITTGSPQLCIDLSEPLPANRFYRVWQTNGTLTLAATRATKIVLSGAIGSSVRVDCINRIGPTAAWWTLDTVTLTNTSQLYFDTSSIGQPPRLWRIVPVP